MDSTKRIREGSNLKLRIRLRSGPRIRANLGPIRIRANSCEFEPASLRAVVRCVLCMLSGLAAVVAWHLSVCRGCGRGCASLVCLVARVVRRASSGPVALGAPVGFPDAVVTFPTPGACAPGKSLGSCAGHAEAGREPGSLCLPLAPAKAGALGY